LHWTKTEDELRSALEKLHQQSIQVLAIYGGDGTIRLTLTEALKIWDKTPLPPILLLRGGTMNVIANSIEQRYHAEEVIKRMLGYSRSADSPFVPTPLLKIHRHPQTDPINKATPVDFGYIFGCGSFVHFLEEYYQSPRPNAWRGFRILVKTALNILIGNKNKILTGLQATVTIDHQLVSQGSHNIIAASTVQGCGLRFKPFYLARPPQPQAHFLLSTASTMQILRMLPKFFSGNPVNGIAGINECSGQKMTIVFEQNQQISLDGDLLPTGIAVEIERGPTLQLLTP
jgi:diacylglycerol kinase family enzyme